MGSLQSGQNIWRPHQAGQEEAEGLEWALGATGRGKGSVGWRSRELYLVWKKPEYVFHTEREPGRRQEFKVRETGRNMT